MKAPRPVSTHGSLARFFREAPLWIVLVLTAGWSVIAIYYSNLPGAWLRTLASVGYVVGIVAVLMRVRPRWKAFSLCFGAFGLIVIWFLLIPPSNERNWQPDVASLPHAKIDGERVTIHNIRNCDYRSETNYTVWTYDKTFDLKALQSVDLYVVYWGSPMIAHTMMSFGFAGGDYVCFSIEARKEKSEGYSALRGFFRQFELIYVVGDERDLVRLRTNYRGEQVYLYRLKTDLTTARLVFLDYLKQVNRLKIRPQWYNAITANCTTLIRGHTKPYAANSRFDWRMLVNGRIDEMAYERGTLDQSLPFPQLKARSLINERAKTADYDGFSKAIREPGSGITNFSAAPIQGSITTSNLPRTP